MAAPDLAAIFLHHLSSAGHDGAPGLAACAVAPLRASSFASASSAFWCLGFTART